MRNLIVPIVLLWSWGVTAAEQLVLNDTNLAPYTQVDKKGFLDIVVGEAFRRAGYRLKLVRLPAERGLYNANRGIEDGDLCRISGLRKKYPNLRRLPEKIIDWNFVAISLDKYDFRIANWKDLDKHSVGIIRGWKILENNISSPSRVSVRNSDILFNLLKTGRVKVIVYSKWMGVAAARRHGIKVRIYEKPLAVREMFIYLHKKHQAKIPKIEAALKSVKSDGFYQKWYETKLGKPGS